MNLSNLPAFRSNGGPSRHHPARSFPFSFEIELPEVPGSLRRLSLFGVFALFAGPDNEAPGTFGATLRGYDTGSETVRYDLINGTSYADGRDLEPRHWLRGDGTSLDTVGHTEVDGESARVDLLTLDIPANATVRAVRFTDMGSPASFAIFDVFAEFELAAGCPFRASSGGVSLGELASVVRVGNRVRFDKALNQLDASIEKADDLDEARGQALTFLAVVTASTLELGGPRSMVRVGLEAARELDRIHDREEIRQAIHRILAEVAEPLFARSENPSMHLIDRALAMLERNYAKDLSDAAMADYVGMSTSHFRHLFREATGQPFHRYLVNLRLEKARALLQDGDLPVSQVATLVGFAGLSHFSRAFSTRFRVSPTSTRRPHAGSS
ncbi:MAG TPA: AraC family transcriptional regulator [Fimbriimonadaceae bacterium]|nr:AraC family transcriptional regulator [Fimbriimonadaceae bacterium]